MPVGVVLVSHSRRLAEGLAELVAQVGQGRVPVAVAAGTADGGLGTDAEAIQAAMELVATPDGAVVLMDLGSAVMAAETALDMLGADLQGRVRLADAPLVEGALAAVVESSMDGTLDSVQGAARAAAGLPKLPE